MANQLLTCVYRPEFGDGYAIQVEATHPNDAEKVVSLRFMFDTLDELLTLLMSAEEQRRLSREDTYTIYDNADRALTNFLCDISCDDERGCV